MEENKQESLADLIKKYRKEKKITQEQLAEAAGISISTLKKYETGLRNPKPEQLRKIAQALGESVQVFMPIIVKNRRDIFLAITQMDNDTNLDWGYKYNSEGLLIPETITISFKDHELNRMLAAYLADKRIMAYSEKLQELKDNNSED